MNSPSSKPLLELPPRPVCRASSSRAGTFCFWTLFVLFIAALGYIGLLAFTADTGPLTLSFGLDGHLLAGMILVGATLAAVAAGIATHPHHHHH